MSLTFVSWLRRKENQALNALSPLGSIKPISKILTPKFPYIDTVESVLFVCTGNICRSAYAATRFTQRAQQDPNLRSITARSAGVSTRLNYPADSRAIEVAESFQVDLNPHRTTPLSAELVRDSDLILVMEPYHQRSVRALARKATLKTCLLGLFNAPSGGNIVILDPFGREHLAYETCFREIDLALERLSQLLASKSST